jgi:hypothetical protein
LQPANLHQRDVPGDVIDGVVHVATLCRLKFQCIIAQLCAAGHYQSASIVSHGQSVVAAKAATPVDTTLLHAPKRKCTLIHALGVLVLVRATIINGMVVKEWLVICQQFMWLLVLQCIVVTCIAGQSAAVAGWPHGSTLYMLMHYYTYRRCSIKNPRMEWLVRCD